MGKAKTKSKVEVPYPRPQRIISIDPAERTGVSIFDGKADGFELETAWEVAGTVRAAAGVLREFAASSDGESMGMVLERQFMKHKRKTPEGGANVVIHGFESLLYRRHIWQVLAEIFGITVTLVYPVSWQSKQLPKKIDEDDTTKERALRACLEKYPDHELIWHSSDNARDAALMGRFFADLVEATAV